MERYTLRDGNRIPRMGFGCFNAFGDEIRTAVERALDVGYRYIDSAEKYDNEEDVGRAIAASGTEREDLFVLSKAWPSSYGDMEAALCRSLKALHVEYLDAYLLHWPWFDEDLRLKAYEQLLKLRDRGLIRTVGVSNFSTEQLERLREEFGDYPAIHEIEAHPSYQQREMADWCRARGIQTIAYSPINRSADLENDTVKRLAAEHGRTPAQIVLRWHVQRGQIPIPKSVTPSRIRENLDVFGFELSPEEMEAVDALESGVRSGRDAREFPVL